MARYRLSPATERDLEAILGWTHEQFGEQARIRYETLIAQALRDVAVDPKRTGCESRPELAENAFTYHIALSRNRVAQTRVRRPRHFLLCRIARDGVLEVGRILHDSMDLARHLPVEYRSAGDE